MRLQKQSCHPFSEGCDRCSQPMILISQIPEDCHRLGDSHHEILSRDERPCIKACGMTGALHVTTVTLFIKNSLAALAEGIGFPADRSLGWITGKLMPSPFVNSIRGRMLFGGSRERAL